MADKLLGKKKKGGKIALYVVLVALTIFALVLIISLATEGGDIFAVLANAHVGWIFASIGVLLLYLALSPIPLIILTKSRKSNISMGKTYAISMTEHFFNGITPFASGGQPFQVYAFARAGVKPSESTSLLIMNFLFHQTAINVFSLLALIWFPKFAGDNVAMLVMAIVGFVVNFLVLAFTVIIGTCPFVRKFLLWCMRILCKIKFLRKFLQPQTEKFQEYLVQVQDVFKDLAKKPLTFIVCLLSKIVIYGVQYAITFFLLLALGVNVGAQDVFFVICGTSFAIMMVTYLPTPGSSGGIELSFALVFASLMGASQANTVAYGGMLLWRLMTYYLAMIISLLFFIGFEVHIAKRKKHALLVSSQTEKTDLSGDNTQNSELADGQNNENADGQNNENGQPDASEILLKEESELCPEGKPEEISEEHCEELAPEEMGEVDCEEQPEETAPADKEQ